MLLISENEGYIAIRTGRFTSFDIYLVKTDKDGVFSWGKAVASDNIHQSASDIIRASDGNYVIAGAEQVNGPFLGYVAIVNSSGDFTCDYTSGISRLFSSLIEVKDEGNAPYFVVTGSIHNLSDRSGDIYIQQLIYNKNANNIVEGWAIQLQRDCNQKAISIIETAKGGFIIAGNRSQTTTGRGGIYLVEIVPDTTYPEFKIVLEKTISSLQGIVSLKTISPTSDNGYILGGTLNQNNSGNLDYFLLKIDSNGEVNENWGGFKTYGSNYVDSAGSVQETAEGGFVVVGQVGDSEGSDDLYIVKTDGLGNMIWENPVLL